MATKTQLLRKDQILSALVETRQHLLAEASALSAAQRKQVFLGIWSVNDLLAHIIGWDETNLRAIKSILQGQVPDFYEYRDRDWHTYNAMLVKKHKKGSFQKILAEAKDSQKRLIEFLQTVAPEDFNKDFGVRFRGYKVTIQRLLEADVKDGKVHYQQITDFFRTSK